MIHAFIKKGCFQDSVSLMIISRKLSESENVDDVSVMMGRLRISRCWNYRFLA